MHRTGRQDLPDCRFPLSSQEYSSDRIQFEFIQLPKILKEGTDKKWLQILSAGATLKDLVQIDASKFNKDVYQSGLEILESYTSEKNYPKLQESSNAAARMVADFNYRYNAGRNFALNKIKISENSKLNEQVLHLVGRYPIETIAKYLQYDIQLVNFIVSTALLFEKYEDPTDQNIEEEFQLGKCANTNSESTGSFE